MYYTSVEYMGIIAYYLTEIHISCMEMKIQNSARKKLHLQDGLSAKNDGITV